eukprot:4492974-Pyramimonas_sp.AAC.1
MSGSGHKYGVHTTSHDYGPRPVESTGPSPLPSRPCLCVLLLMCVYLSCRDVGPLASIVAPPVKGSVVKGRRAHP